MRLLLLPIALVVACQSSSSKQDKPDKKADDYTADINKICNVEKLSGAEADETTARTIIAAEWLGRNLTTDRARDFLAEVARVSAADKARKLRAEAKKLGLADCPTAIAWETLKPTGEPAGP